ncbi:MAG: RNA polymerase sigma factor [Candidatus Onthomonas sp.]
MTEAQLLDLFDQYHNDVYRLALSCTRSPQDAEDVTQTVFLKLWERRPELTPGKEKAWLTQVTVNQCRDLLRALRRHRVEPLEAAAGVTFTHPEESALFAAVLSLPARERVAVHLHYYEGYSQEEVAKLLKLSPSAISMRLHRARKHLKSALKEEYDYETALPEHL